MRAVRFSWVAVIFFAAVCVLGVLMRPLLPIDETRYVAVAWEMWLSGDYLVPTKNFALYTHKPPLLFWTINMVWAVTGVSEIAARLVGPAYALATVVLTGALARRLWPQDAGIGGRAMLALAGLIPFAIYGSSTMFDAMLAAATVLGLIALISAIQTGAWRWWAVIGVAIALGVLAKGPVILLHLLPAMVTVPFWARGRSVIGARQVALGCLLALGVGIALVCLWLVPAIISGGPEYRDAVLWSQSAGRVTQSFAHARPIWFFAAALPLMLFPWIWVPFIWRAAFRGNWSEPGMRLAVIWAMTAFVLFSLISGKQLHYLIPEMPAVALIVARLLRDAPRFRLIPALIPMVLLALVVILAASGLVPLGKVAQLIDPNSMLLAMGFLLLAFCWLAMQLGGLKGGLALTLGCVASLNLLIGLTSSYKIYDTHHIADVIAPFQDEGIASYGLGGHAQFNFAGRLTKPVVDIPAPDKMTEWMDQHPQGVIIARRDRLTPDWLPRETILYRNAPFAVWHVADRPVQELSK